MLTCARVLCALTIVSILGVPSLGAAATASRTAAVLKAGLSGEDAGLIEAVKSQLTNAGYQVKEIDAQTLCDSKRLNASKPDLLVLTRASVLPLTAAPSIDSYLRAGGDLIALNTPMWQQPLLSSGGRWVGREEFLREQARAIAPHTIFRFSPEDIAGWERGAADPHSPTIYETIPDGPADGQRALHAEIPNLGAWDGFTSPELKSPFGPGETLTVFSAKGGPRTSKLSIEWTEKDGSRWIAVIPLSTEWRRYALKPSDFHYWKSNPSRGDEGDCLRPESAYRISVGLSYTHTSNTSGRHEYWVGPIGVDKENGDYDQLRGALAPLPALDTLSPFYKLFHMNDTAALRVRGDQSVIGPAALPVPSALRSPHPRAQAAGFDKGRDWRWISLIEGVTSNGEWRGAPATLTVNASGAYKGGVWASFGVEDPSWYRKPAVLRAIGQVAARMKNGAYILDGGADAYTYFRDEQIRLGATLTNVSDAPVRSLTARIALEDLDKGRVVRRWEWPVELAATAKTTVSTSIKPSNWPAKGFRVTVELIEAGQVIDRVAHDVVSWAPRKSKQFVTSKDGEFFMNGKRWRANGVNYMPSSGIGTEDADYFHYWLEPRSYDPEVVDRDLDHIRDIGMNAVSIFIFHRSLDSRNLTDLLRRIDAHGMKANLALRPWQPMVDLHEQWPKMKELIERYRLRDNDVVFAYDVDWEPTWLNDGYRRQWEDEWEQWIVERYGSVANAEKDWGFPAPRNAEGKICTPPSANLDVDGEWRRMSAAYRRFLDTLLYEHYGTARRLIRTVDTNHPVSFRMHAAGTATCEWQGLLAYDWPYLGSGVDLFEPEAYALATDSDSIRTGRFTREYARWCSSKNPLFWAEVGLSLTEGLGDTEPTPDRYQQQARFIEDFYRMLTDSGTNGIFFWWYPGGFRTGENSDYGIINPDGSDRPATKVVRDWSARYLNGATIKPDMYIEIDRDAYTKSNGIAGVYTMVKDRFWSAIEQGHNPGLRTSGTGTDSATCPLLAVGNTPCNGSNPPKYLDGAIDSVEVQDADGKWTSVGNGGSIEVRPGKQVKARVSLTNLGEATWLARSSKPGEVRALITAGSETHQAAITGNVPQSGSILVRDLTLTDGIGEASSDVTITLTAVGRTAFGPKFRVTLTPRH